MELREMDLNLLLPLAALYQERSVSRAAESLGMSQPGVSSALNRLRRLLGDELFLRTGHGMQPTPYAERLHAPLSGALEAIHATLNLELAFDPRTSIRNFTLAMTDIGEIDFLPGLLAALRERAPGVTLSTVRRSQDSLKDAMEAGQVDLAVGLLPDLAAGVHQRQLTTSRYVCLFRQGHALDKPAMDPAEYAAAEHLVVVAAGTGHGAIDAHLERIGVCRNVRLRVPHFAAVGHLLQGSELVATVPLRLVRRCAGPFGLAWAPVPHRLRPIAVTMFWPSRFHRDPSSRWLRNLMFELFHGDGGATP